MTDETNDDETPRPKLKAIEDYVNPDNEKKTLDFTKAKEGKKGGVEKPKLKTKFDFMSGDKYVLLDIQPAGTNCVELTYFTVEWLEGIPFIGEGYFRKDFAAMYVEMKWYDSFFGVRTLEQKIDKVGMGWKKEIQKHLKFNLTVKDISNKFSL